jgi:neuronal cell adhesion protein
MNLLERTVIRDGPEDYEVAAGQTATFRCNAVADSSLNLTIEWLHADQLIDFEQEPRFVQSQDSSLTITKTTELDTGDYTCRAKTILDLAEDKATLIVQGKERLPPFFLFVFVLSLDVPCSFSCDHDIQRFL